MVKGNNKQPLNKQLVIFVVVIFVVILFHQSRSTNTVDENIKTSASPCKPIDVSKLAKGKDYRGQSGEDLKLLEWFNGLCHGTYIEMGALDGIRYSNSLVFNGQLKWKGVLIELSPTNFQNLQRNRKRELALVHAGVCAKRQTLHFVDSEKNAVKTAVGGIWEFAAESFRKHWWPNVTLDMTTEFTCLPMQEILDTHVKDQQWFDFFSLDIEGAELQALQSLDFDRVGFGVILVEADEHNEEKNAELRNFIVSKGYNYLFAEGRSYWFANKEFPRAYGTLVDNQPKAAAQ